MLLSRFDHHNLGVVPAFHMLGLGYPLCRYGLRIMQDFVPHLISFKQSISRFGISIAESAANYHFSGLISTFHQANTAAKRTAREHLMYG